ncbi:MAG: 3-hydroxyacyl-CoA dehydrogenase NAD-binding domain-containing protein [Bacteriovoracaceae bacterium]
MSFESISYEIKEKVAYIGFGKEAETSMPILNEPTLKELKEALEKTKEDQKNLSGLIFFSHKDKAFLAGADINLIASLKTEAEAQSGAEHGQVLFNLIEDLKIPTVVCVHGPCLGGGMELALSCDRIIASDDSKTVLGLPEVKLGLIPGFGGTYRMPRRVGLPKALDLILTGKAVKAKKAKKMGLVDQTYPKERLVDMALKELKSSKEKTSFKETLENLASDNFVSRKIIFQKARENVLEKTKGFYHAPLKILDVMEHGMGKSRSSYLSIESQAFGELCVSEQSKNLQHIFFLMEGAKKYSGPKSEKDVPKLNRGAVLGAGTMGGGIAWLMASTNMHPIMRDLNHEALELGLKQASRNFSKQLKRRRISKDDFQRKVRSITPQIGYEGFKSTDLVIEAIVENIDIKKKVFSELEKEVRNDCVVVSNTSSLSIEDMASSFEMPERFAGLHFFNPVNMMPLVEIITHSKVSPETIEALYKWVLRAKKTPIIVKDGPGFLVNRILMPFMNEAGFLMEEGVSIEQIEEACLNFGMPMGPARLMDEVGLDVAQKVAKIIHEGVGDRLASCSAIKKLVDAEMYGKKNSKGFYLYDEKGKHTEINPEVRKFFPSSQKSMDEVEIQKRIFLPMINEAAAILDEKIVESAEEVDLGLIFGIGFPPFRGGLLRYADNEGLERLHGAMLKFSESVSAERYTPVSYLQGLVDNKKKFYE